MNKKILVLFLGILLVGALGFVTALWSFNESTSSGLVGHWTLDGADYNSVDNRVTDKSAYENHGINNGAILASDRMGSLESVMSFDGDQPLNTYETNQEYIEIPESQTIRPKKEWSVSAWVKPDVLPQTGNGAGIFDYGSNNRISIQVINSGVRINVGGVWSVASGSFSDVGAGAGEFIHVVAVYDNSTSNGDLKLYFNNQLVDSKTGIAEPVDHTQSAWIGRRKDHYGHTLKGDIDEVRFYNRALSVSEIESLYNSYKPKVSGGPLKKGLIFDMPLTLTYTKSEVAGSETMTDRTPYSNDGTNNNAIIGSDYASFDGDGDFINMGNVLDQPNNNFTLSAWASSTSTAVGNNNGIIYKRGTGSSSSAGYRLNMPNGAFNIHIANGTDWATLTAGSGYNDGEWHFVSGVVTRNGGLKIYIDGVLVGSSTSTIQGDITSTVPIAVGALTTNGISYYHSFDGQISNVRIYNRALSENEVESLYAKGRYI